APTTAPQITSVSPNPVTGSNSVQTIAINGTGVVNKPTVAATLKGGSRTLTSGEVIFVSSTLVQMTINVSTTADNNWTVKVTNPNSPLSLHDALPIFAPTTAPQITSVSPNPVTGSNSVQTIAING